MSSGQAQYCLYFCTLPSDAFARDTTDQAVVDEKIWLIIDMQDPDIVNNLRHHNRGRESVYDPFWEVLQVSSGKNSS